MYAHAVDNPFSYTDPDGRDVIAVNFSKQVPLGGHEGIVSIHADGRAAYARFGPRDADKPFGQGQVNWVEARERVEIGPDGLPTEAAYKKLAEMAAEVEGQNPDTVRMNYFKTSDAEAVAVDAWMQRNAEASVKGKAAQYDVTQQNCATFCIAGLIQANAIQNSGISLIPNQLFKLLSQRSDDNYPRPKPKKEKVDSKICYPDEKGKEVCQ